MVLFGVLTWVWVGTMQKLSSYQIDPANTWAPFVRQIGILALGLPLLWIIFTIKKERDQTSDWTRRHTIIAGVATTILMIFLLTQSAAYGRLVPRISITR